MVSTIGVAGVAVGVWVGVLVGVSVSVLVGVRVIVGVCDGVSVGPGVGVGPGVSLATAAIAWAVRVLEETVSPGPCVDEATMRMAACAVFVAWAAAVPAALAVRVAFCWPGLCY
jgi:hypothetical protein